MSDPRSGSQSSLISYQSQPSTEQLEAPARPPSPESPRSRTTPPGNPPGSPRRSESSEQYDEKEDIPAIEAPPSSRSSSPKEQRVRFRSHLSIDYAQPLSPETSEDKEKLQQRENSEREKAEHGDQPHRPSTPYMHGSLDITDTSLQDRTGPSEQEQAREGAKAQVAEPRSARAAEAISDFGRRAKDKIRSFQHTVHEKAVHLADHLGRPGKGGDDLNPGVYHPDWAAGGAAPLADVTDNKHKSEEEKKKHQATSNSEAHRLVRELNQDQSSHRRSARGKPLPQGGSKITGGENDLGIDSGLRYRSGGGGILSQLMKLSGNQQQQGGGQQSPGTTSDGGTSGASTPKKEKLKWYKNRPGNTSTSTLVGASASLSGASTPASSQILTAASKRRSKQGKGKGNMRLEDEIRVTVHIAEIIARQRYIMQLCRALMQFGAPTHRLEEYMQMTAKVLEVDGQFLYLPGCMIMSFDDPSTRTTEVKLVRVAQGINLSKLAATHSIYKNVVHDVIGVEEATRELEDVMNQKPRFNKWIQVLVYGLASATIGPFAFNARPIDMPIIFVNGCLLGFMALILAPASALYSNVFEVTAAVLTSFLARAFGSIPKVVVDGRRQYLFCFSAIAQSSIALILPGFLVLCSSLELQSHQIIAGSIRIVYAIIYSLFLGYGITVGTTIYGLMDGAATSEINCPKEGAFKNPYVQRFPFVVLLVLWLLIINQGKFKQLPVMAVIALAGYVSNYFSTKKLGSNNQVGNTVGSFTIGVMGNLYSRVWHGHAATAILPGIFVLVPSGLAASGSLITGVQSADSIKQNISSHGASGGGGGGGSQPGAGLPGTASLSLGFGMIQVAIGITVGLFLSALVVYPYGKRRSGLFSF